MSAYALPGSFFFPSNLDESNEKDEPSKESASSSPNLKEKESWYNPNDLLISIKSASIDHIRLIQGFTGRRSSTSSRRSSFRDRVASLSNSLTGFSLASSFTETDEHWGEYVDEDEHEEEEVEEHISTNHSTVPLGSPRERKVQFQFDDLEQVSARRESVGSSGVTVCAASVNGNEAVYPTLSDSSAQNNSQDDAIQFTLSITFNGRKYTATRALPSFVKLRNDLVKEIENKKNSPNRSQRLGFSYNSDSDKEEEEEAQYDNKSNVQNDDPDVIIPELPLGVNAIDSDKSGGLMGMAGRGFRGLQETVKNYCPPMENWIRSVAALVPSSPILANFLWEPIQINPDELMHDMSSDAPRSLHTSNRSSLRNSLRGSTQTLISITESADTDSDGDVAENDARENVGVKDGKEDFIVS